MAVPLVQLLATVPNQEIRVAAGVDGLQNPIRWVHMVEGVEISTFLEGGELAFVTGIALNESCTLARLIASIQQHGAGGIVVNTGPYIKAIPAEVTAFCNQNKFPLLVVPWRVHMAVIMRQFSQALLRSEQEQTEWTAAVKNMIFHPQEESLYRPTLESRGMQPEGEYCVTLLEPADSTFLQPCLQVLENYTAECKEAPFYAELNGQILLLSANCTPEAAKREVQKLMKSCMDHLPGLNLYAGTGRSVKTVRCLSAGYHLAQKVLALQKRRNAVNQPSLYDDLGVYRLLMAVEDDRLLREYTEAILGPLQAASISGDTDYLHLLTVWFECNCSTQRTAERLFLHRNTVEYHLRRIGNLLQADMSDMEVRLQINLALKLLELAR